MSRFSQLRPEPRLQGFDLFSLDPGGFAPILPPREDSGPDPLEATPQHDGDDALSRMPDHFDFIPEAVPHSTLTDQDVPGAAVETDLAVTWISPTLNATGDGRPDPDPDPGPSTPAEDSDPDPAPPPVVIDTPPDYEDDGGRPEDATPGTPTVTPPSPEPGPGNEIYGRPEDAEPDPVPTPVTTYTSGGAAASSFNVTVEFEGNWTIELQQAFVTAAEYLSSVILADIPDELVDGVLVDDLNITATLAAIDGVGGTLGSAGPRAIRDVTYLPATGAMTFDIADANDLMSEGTWQAVVLHEMMHTLGFGSHLGLLGLTSGSVAGGDIRFTGENAIFYYNTEFSGIAASDPDSWLGVPLEADGGSGTAGGHWDELLFDNEIMTGYNDASNYVSTMTLAALEDIGYDTVIDDIGSASDLTGPIPPDPLFDVMA